MNAQAHISIKLDAKIFLKIAKIENLKFKFHAIRQVPLINSFQLNDLLSFSHLLSLD